MGTPFLCRIDSAIIVLSNIVAFSERKRASRNRKYYPVDSGLRRVVVTRTGADRGKALELATYLALQRHFGEVFYWRGRGEIDFVARDGDQIIPVQVSWDGGLDLQRQSVFLNTQSSYFPEVIYQPRRCKKQSEDGWDKGGDQGNDEKGDIDNDYYYHAVGVQPCLVGPGCIGIFLPHQKDG